MLFSFPAIAAAAELDNDLVNDLEYISPEMDISHDFFIRTRSTPADIFTSGGLYRIRNSTTNGYISGRSSNAVIQSATLSTTRGYELWCFWRVSEGIYRIESIGVRTGYGTVSNMLTANAASQTATTGTLSLSSYNANNARQWWCISNSSNGYCITSYYYPNLKISVASSTLSPTLTASPTYAEWVPTATSEYADYWSGGYANATAPYNINVIIAPSAVTTYLTESVYSCATTWNTIDSNIFLRYYPSTYTGSYAACDMTVTVVGSNANGDWFGRLVPYPYVLNGTWSELQIQIALDSNKMNSSSASIYDQQKVFLHELGHALKLCHTDEYHTGWQPVSIMSQGLVTTESYAPARQTGYDKYNLSRKW